MLDAKTRTKRTDPIVPADTRLGAVHIAVTTAERALAVWRDIVGLDVIAQTGTEIRLGAGGKTLIVLEVGADRPVVPNTTGLYHVAIHVPTRADLARLVLRAASARIRFSPTDHLVSEAVYLWDIDGNGIEITFETPWRGTLENPDETGRYAVTAEGRPHSGREPIDLDGLMQELDGTGDTTSRLPGGTRVGHVHVHVNDLDTAMQFYADTLGFGRQLLSDSFGMGDVMLNYQPHILAFNIWSGRDAQRPPAGSAGLRWFTIVLPDAGSLAAMKTRLADAGCKVEPNGTGLWTFDPSGNRLSIELAA